MSNKTGWGIISYSIEHIEQIKTLMTGGFFIAAFFLNKVLSKKLSAARVKGRMKKQLVYLEKYSRYLGDEDKKYLKKQINDEVMKSVMGLDYYAERKDLFYIHNRINDGAMYNDIVSLRRELCKNEEGEFHINYKNSRLKIAWHYFFLFFLAAITLVYIFMGITFLQQQQYVPSAIFIVLGIIFELAFAWYCSTWVSNRRIEKINAVLSGLPPSTGGGLLHSSGSEACP